MGKKGFDNLENKEQGEKPKKEEAKHQDQEKTMIPEETASCEHQNERERLEKENQAEAEENQQSNGIKHWLLEIYVSKPSAHVVILHEMCSLSWVYYRLHSSIMILLSYILYICI